VEEQRSAKAEAENAKAKLTQALKQIEEAA